MSLLRIAPIVEGHGEIQAIRILLERVWCELLGGQYLDVLAPFREPRSKLVLPAQLARVVQTVGLKLRDAGRRQPMPALILILLDADEDLPCVIGPQILDGARKAAAHLDITCVIANVEYETWFVAAASSLGEYLHVPARLPERPEQTGQGKGWIQQHFRRSKYSEPLDQPRMTARMDLSLCRARCPSFDKLCRELELRRSTD